MNKIFKKDDYVYFKVTKDDPDYSISIAYKVDEEHTTTMGGETYKQLVLTNMHVS